VLTGPEAAALMSGSAAELTTPKGAAEGGAA
jgi:hypothetical protein